MSPLLSSAASKRVWRWNALWAAALAALAACATAPPSATSIFGSWRIEDVDGGGVIDSARLEVEFAADGRVSGHAGCNGFTGRYTSDGAGIDIGPLASTRRACSAEALSRQEARVLRSLDAAAAVTWTPDGALVLSGPAPARLLLRRMDVAPSAEPAAPLVVSGEVFFLELIALPPDALLRVTAQDVARADAPAPTLAQVEIPAANGPPFGFALDIPRELLTSQSRVAVRAQILSGYEILFTSTERHAVALDGAPAPLRIRVSPVEAASGAGSQPVTPVPQIYTCDGESLRIAFEEGIAFVTFADGRLARLARLRSAGGDDPEAARMFTDGSVTLRQEIDGERSVSFARGRAALVSCARG